jgi:hypothetical protein
MTRELMGLLERCRTVLGNMALENEGAIFNRWPINHEPLRSDAKNLVPLIDEALAQSSAESADGSYLSDRVFEGVRSVDAEDAERLKASYVASRTSAQLQASADSAQPVAWPSREVIAREIRRAMLDNPTEESFNKRAEAREAIANVYADIIIERFAASRHVSEPAGATVPQTAGRAPADQNCPIGSSDPSVCSAGCCIRCSDWRDGFNAARSLRISVHRGNR